MTKTTWLSEALITCICIDKSPVCLKTWAYFFSRKFTQENSKTFQYFNLFTFFSFLKNQFCTVQPSWIKKKNLSSEVTELNWNFCNVQIEIQVWLVLCDCINKSRSELCIFWFTKFDCSFWLYRCTLINKPKTLKWIFSETFNKSFLKKES